MYRMRNVHNNLPDAGCSQAGIKPAPPRIDKLCAIRNLQRETLRFEEQLKLLYGICLNEGMALCSLSQAGVLSSGELGELLDLTPSNTSKVLASLEQKGLIARALGSQDKRRMYFSLTDRGRTLLSKINDCEKIAFNG